VSLFIVGDQRSHYNAINAPNYLPRQWSARLGGNLDYYIIRSLFDTRMRRRYVQTTMWQPSFDHRYDASPQALVLPVVHCLHLETFDTYASLQNLTNAPSE
jgi:hypothetical protein